MSENQYGEYDQGPQPPAPGSATTATQAPPPPPPVPPTAVGTATPEPAGRHRSSGVGFASFLIFAGVLLLIAQVVPGISWWNLWPLIIIAAGVVQAVTPGSEGWSVYRFFDGLVTVAFGLVFLAITVGLVGWSIWWRILGLWPVLLIAIGFDILGKSLRSSWLRVIGSVAIMAALAYALAVSMGGLGGIRFGEVGTPRQVSVSEAVRSEESATLRLDAGVADLKVSAGDELVTLDGSSPFGDPAVSVDRSGDTAEVRVEIGDEDGRHIVAWPGGDDAELEMTLSDEVVWDATMETGLSTLDADLSDLMIGSLSLKPGIADCSVTLGDAPDDTEGRISVKAGISTVKLRVPSDAEVRLTSSGGLSTSNIDGQLDSLGGGVWETPGFEQARSDGDPVWVISVESGMGTFDLDTY